MSNVVVFLMGEVDADRGKHGVDATLWRRGEDGEWRGSADVTVYHAGRVKYALLVPADGPPIRVENPRGRTDEVLKKHFG